MFSILANDRVMFYGYPTYHHMKERCSELQQWGVHCLGYLDKNAQAISRKTGMKNIWTIDTLILDEISRKDTIIILLLQNGRIHGQIAEELYRKGFEKVLFVPRNLDSIWDKKMCNAYNLFWEGDFGQLKNIPERSDWGKPMNADNHILTTGRYTTQKIPVSDIYTDNQPVKFLPEKNISEESPYTELFEFLEDKKEDCPCYAQMTGFKGEQFEALLKDRKTLYEAYEHNWFHNKEFFYFSAPHVRWNEKGYFNIIDGHHRGIYLAYKGEKEIYVRARKEDIKLWEFFNERKEGL